MSECTHRNLLLLAPPKDRIRCTHCHLTIKRDELTRSYCPECYESEGVRRNQFEEVTDTENAPVHYRCEDCGALIPATQYDKSRPLGKVQ